MTIDLATARRMIEAARRISREKQLKPMTFVVTDDGGHVVAAQREDGSSLLRFEIAYGKAFGALGMGHSTRFFEDVLVKNRPYFANSLEAASQGRFITVYGGVLIRDAQGALLGAMGVTGDSGVNDEKVAALAIGECGLGADMG